MAKLILMVVKLKIILMWMKVINKKRIKMIEYKTIKLSKFTIFYIGYLFEFIIYLNYN